RGTSRPLQVQRVQQPGPGRGGGGLREDADAQRHLRICTGLAHGLGVHAAESRPLLPSLGGCSRAWLGAAQVHGPGGGKHRSPGHGEDLDSGSLHCRAVPREAPGAPGCSRPGEQPLRGWPEPASLGEGPPLSSARPATAHPRGGCRRLSSSTGSPVSST
ncbi:GIP, partial [Symbiodinium sp. CCMP2456]